MPTFTEISERIAAFNAERNWIHLDPADLAKSIVLEAAELLEHFQWDNTAVHNANGHKQKDEQEIAHEAADVLMYLIAFCQEKHIDLLQAVMDKIELNAKKYPVQDT